VRFIGDARTRIREDYLRVLRFFRFHAAYAVGALDPDGLAAAIAERDGLATLSAERVRIEMLKLLTAPRGVEAVAALSEGGLLLRLVGGVGDLGRLARAVDLAEAAKAVAANAAEPSTAATRLAALAVFTAEDAERLREKLRLSNAEHARLEAYAGLLARLHGLASLDGAEMRRLAVAFGVPALVEALAVIQGEPRPVLTPEAEALRGRYAAGVEAAPVFPLSGRDLVARGVAPGPGLGRRLAAARARWLAAGCPEGMGVEDLLAGTMDDL
jgi:poly(A) polymerase